MWHMLSRVANRQAVPDGWKRVDACYCPPNNEPSAKMRGSASKSRSLAPRSTRRAFMRRNLILGLGAALVAAGVAAWLFLGAALAAAPALAGTWRVTFFPPTGQEMSLWLLQVEAKKGELTAKVIAAPADERKQAK